MRIFSIFVLSALLLLTACPQDNGTSSTSAGKSTHSGIIAAPVATAGGAIHLPLEYVLGDTMPTAAELDISDPHLWALARCVELTLVRVSPSGELLPGLATSWEYVEDAALWRFDLSDTAGKRQPDALFSALRDHWRTILQGAKTPLREQLADLIAGAADFRDGRDLAISGLDLADATLSIELTRPHAGFAAWVSQPGLGLVDGHSAFNFADDNALWDGQELVLVANPDSLIGAPLLDELRFYCAASRKEQVQMFREGKLDTANVPIKQAAAIESDEELAGVVVQHETASMILALVDHSEFPWADGEFQLRVGLRQALNWGVDLTVLADDQNFQFAPWPHMLPHCLDSFIDAEYLQSPPLSMGMRIEDARDGLKRADVDQGNGLPRGMDVAYFPGEHLNSLAKNARDYWHDVSIRLALFSEPREILLERIDRRGNEVVLVRFRPAYPGADAVCYPLLHSALAGLGGNWSWLEDETLDALIERAQATTDATTQQLTYRKLTREVEDRALMVCLGYATPTLLVNPRLAGYQLSPYDFDASLPAQDFSKLGWAE